MANWTEKEIADLIELYGEFPNSEVAAVIGRTKQSVQHKAHRLGLTTKLVAEKKYCVDCGVELSRASIYKKTACRCMPCAMLNHSGEKHHNWNGGVAKLRSIVHCFLKPVWIDPIMVRDKFTCQICEKVGGDLAVHHLRPYYLIRDNVISKNKRLSVEAFEDRKQIARLIVEEHSMDDGLTLCVGCHKKIHSDSRGELLGSPNGNAEGNQQPSRPNVISMVGRKVQRLTGEESQANKPDTSAPQAESLSAGRYSLGCVETRRSKA